MINGILSNVGINIVATVISVFAALISGIFVMRQYFISKHKRRDDLFKVRYEVYQEIIEFIKIFEPHFVNTINTINISELKRQQRDGMAEEERDRLLRNIKVSKNILARQIYSFFCSELRIPMTPEFLVKKNSIIFKTKCLFDQNLANFLDNYLNQDTLGEEVKKYYQCKRDELGCDNNFLKQFKDNAIKESDFSFLENSELEKELEEQIRLVDDRLDKHLKERCFFEQLIQEKILLRYWTSPKKLNDQFERYLKIK